MMHGCVLSHADHCTSVMAYARALCRGPVAVQTGVLVTQETALTRIADTVYFCDAVKARGQRPQRRRARPPQTTAKVPLHTDGRDTHHAHNDCSTAL
jgi:hypothetical protein